MGERQQQHCFFRETLTAYLIFGLLLVFVGSVSANVIGHKDQDAAETAPGLYNATDQVYILDNINFKSSVLQSKRAWLVEFYNSWCGFCHRFAPIWKALAKSVHGWRKIVTIAAIDCANDDNNPLCREYEVMRYPTLKFFPVNSKLDFLGLELQKDKDEELIMQALVDQLEKEQQEQRGGLDWPNLAPYRNNDIETLWQGVPASIEYQFLIFEEPNAHLAAQVILDLYKLNNVRIRRATSENVLLTVASKVNKYPSILAIYKDHTQTNLKVDTLTREGLREAILEFLKLKGISVDIKDDISDETIKQKSVSGHQSKVHAAVRTEDKLYQLDLETAVRYSLNNEIPLSKNISGEKLKALQSYLKALAHYFPAYLPKMKTYLQVLREIVDGKNNITGKDFRKEVKSKEEGLSPIYSGPKNTWIGCKGSDPTFRGYPCGLWTLFHTLTVAAADDINDEQVDYNQPTPVLSAMHGYIKNFFGCANCSDHFQEMSKKRDLFGVRGNDESILWLWRAHNEVNERLAGDETEDPEYKKIQYPSSDHCPQCKRADGKWDENEVLIYLKTKYGKSSIDLEGISDQLLQRERDVSASSSGVSHRKIISWDFTIFDISICVVLYVASAAILTMVCIKFAYKRTHKKKTSYHNLFGVA